MEGGVGHGLTDLRNDIDLYLDRKENTNNEVTTKKSQVVHDKDGMSEKKVSPRKRKRTKKGKKGEAEKEMSKKVDLRKLVRDVEEQKRILDDHQRILNQVLEFYKSNKNKSISLYYYILCGKFTKGLRAEFKPGSESTQIHNS